MSQDSQNSNVLGYEPVHTFLRRAGEKKEKAKAQEEGEKKEGKERKEEEGSGLWHWGLREKRKGSKKSIGFDKNFHVFSAPMF